MNIPAITQEQKDKLRTAIEDWQRARAKHGYTSAGEVWSSLLDLCLEMQMVTLELPPALWALHIEARGYHDQAMKGGERREYSATQLGKVANNAIKNLEPS